MTGGYKKSWSVRSYPEAVVRMLKQITRVFDEGYDQGIVGWMGRTYSHQRKDFRPKPPRLTVERENHLVFQQDLVTPFTFTVDVAPEGPGTRVIVEVKASGMVKDAPAADAVVPLLFALTKALEPGEPPKPET